MKHVLIVGAGQMGRGIAYTCGVAGYQTTIVEPDNDQRHQAQYKIAHRIARAVEREELSVETSEAAHKMFRFIRDIEECDAHAIDMMIEAVPEDNQLKARIFSEMSHVLSDTAILASNTSSISITQLATAARDPERVIGLHFMNPVPVMALVELIPGLRTCPTVVADIETFVTTLGKTAILSQDRPGFIVNRILMPMINEAIFALSEGVGDAAGIDTAMRLGTNQPMGPLALADLIGLDTCLAIMQVLYQGFSDSKYRPCPLLVNYVKAGWLGKKTGRGFYIYETHQPER